jgi:hypothetical protein
MKFTLTTFKLLAHAALSTRGGIKLQSFVVLVDTEMSNARYRGQVSAPPVGVYGLEFIEKVVDPCCLGSAALEA